MHDHHIAIDFVTLLGFGRSRNGFSASTDQRARQREEETKGLRLFDLMCALAMPMGMASANRVFFIFIGQRNRRSRLPFAN